MSAKASDIERKALELTDDPILAQMLEEERVESQDFDLTLLWKLLSFAKPHSKLALTAVILAVIESLLMTFPAYVTGLALDRATGGNRAPQLVDTAIDQLGAVFVGPNPSPVALMGFFGAIVGVAWLSRWLLSMTSTFVVHMMGQRVLHDLRVRVFTHVTSMSLSYFHKNPVGRLVNRTTFDVQSLSELFSEVFAHGLRDIVFIIVLTTVMFSLDPVLAAILVGSFPVLIIVAMVYRALARAPMRTSQAVQSRMNSWLAENLSGMRENQLYRREDRRRAEYHSLTEAHQASMTRVIQSWAVLRPGMMVTTACATGLVLTTGYDRVQLGIISVGVLLTFVEYAARLWVPVRNLTEKFNVVQTALTAGERVFDVLETPSTMVDAEGADRDAIVESGAVEFESVRFAYRKDLDLVLQDVSFRAEPGEMIALVGDTGAGKTTIVSLLSRFYDVVAGSVKVDGRDVRDYTLQQLRRGIALVPQDVVVFAGSLRDNVTLGAEVDDDTIFEALEAIGARDLAERFDEGLDHVLEESGRTLSAGERQLLSFARALIANPPILVLDEATASIDSQTEARVQAALTTLTKGRTTIVIAHRLSTIRDADQILVLRHGEVIERGTHEQLLDLDGEYARLHHKHIA